MKEYIANVKDYLISKIETIKKILLRYRHLEHSKDNFELLFDEIDNSNIISMSNISNNSNTIWTDYFFIIILLEQQLNNLQLMLNAIEWDNN